MNRLTRGLKTGRGQGRWRLSLAIALLVVASCAKKPSSEGSAPSPAEHHHAAPHGGTAIVLGREAYHLELVLDAAAGKLSAYVLDGEMENFVRISALEFEVNATVQGAARRLVFRPIANDATGEKAGDTSQFEAEAEWLKTTSSFEAMLLSLDVRGNVFSGVTFRFPQGNEKG